MTLTTLPSRARLKLDLLFEGIRYTEALGAAAPGAYPNYYPYRFQPGEHDPTGAGKANIPYLLTLEDGTLVRIKGNGSSPWSIAGSPGEGYRLVHDAPESREIPASFEPLPQWFTQHTDDGFPMAQAGISLHGDMAVINVAPGCEYFLHKRDGVSMRCTFCAYGAPDKRTEHLGQRVGEVALPERTYERMQHTLRLALQESGVRHIFLVGGSLPDWHQEGERFVEIARRVQAVNDRRIPVTCGSGALPDDILEQLRGEALVDNVCFNLEIWSESLFAKVCPGKNTFVGYQRWLRSLETAVAMWGREHVYSAMVAGVELEPEHGLSWQAAAELAIEGADELCARGIIPIYSLYWPVGGRDHPDYMSRLRSYFERLSLGYQESRRRHDLRISDSFMCHRCAYMQLECDIDREIYEGSV